MSHARAATIEAPSGPDPMEHEHVRTDVVRCLDVLDRVSDQRIAGFYLADRSGFSYVNRALAEMLGRSVDELLALPSVLEVVHPDDLELVGRMLAARLDGSATEVRYEFRAVRPGGAIVHLETHGFAVQLGPARMASGVLHDITHRKEVEEHYLHAQRMEAVGLFASGIVHDFNNLLTVVGINAGILEEEWFPGAVPDELAEIRNATDRLAELTRMLLSFGRRTGAALEPVEVREVVGETIVLARRLIGEDVHLRTDLAPDSGAVRADARRIEQALMNLLANARDALPAGGLVRLSTRRVRVKEAESHHGLTLRPGEYASITVADTGTGIDPEALHRIFEPYYTTKGERGTGLGLSTVWTIVADAGGAVRVRSAPAAGTAFELLLPLTPEGRRRRRRQGSYDRVPSPW